MERNEHNSVLFHMVPPVCSHLNSCEEQINRKNEDFQENPFSLKGVHAPLICLYKETEEIKKRNAHHITSIKYKNNSMPERN